MLCWFPGGYVIGSNFKGTSLKTLQLNNLKLFWLKLVFESSFKRCLVHRFSMWGSTRVRTWKNRRKAFCSHGKSLRKKKTKKGTENLILASKIGNIPKLSLFCKKNSWSCVLHLFLKPKAPRLIKLSLHLRELTAGTWKHRLKPPIFEFKMLVLGGVILIW